MSDELTPTEAETLCRLIRRAVGVDVVRPAENTPELWAQEIHMAVNGPYQEYLKRLRESRSSAPLGTKWSKRN